ncbi:uncharacterized protein LOC126034640 [Accipiter gentilis]|uniref:uncharacterized protein LOC126034640 n=1 Tax=Astur gentilis TaxID=8957 RepID=UPI002110AD52|nr:uncharacterized protein LOC126034640 [Accipiter gentilis]
MCLGGLRWTDGPPGQAGGDLVLQVGPPGQAEAPRIPPLWGSRSRRGPSTGGSCAPRRGCCWGPSWRCVGRWWGCWPPPAPPPLAPALLQTLAGAAALGGRLLRDPPRLPHGYAPCLDLLRAVSGTIVFFITALVALAASRDALAATTFTFSLILSFLFAFDAFVTYRTEVAPAVGREPDMDSA